MLVCPKPVSFHSLGNLGQALLAFAGNAARPSVHTKCIRLNAPDAVLLADPQSLFGAVGRRRWLAEKDANERGLTQRLDKGQRVPKRLGASYRCPQLLERPVRVAEHPG